MPLGLRRLLPFVLLLAIAWLAGARDVAAQQWAKSPDGSWYAVQASHRPGSFFESDGQLRLVGVTLLAGLPDGIAPGISVHPLTNLLHVDLAVTGLFSFGVRGGVTFDPFDWVVAPTLTVAGGYNGWATLPSTQADYQLFYLNIQPGIEVGRRSRYRVFLRAGYSHFWVTGRNSSTFNGVSPSSDPSLNINLLPSFNLGITTYLGP